MALSVDDQATTEELVAKHQLPFPIGCEADAEAIRGTWGSSTRADPQHLQPTGVVLSPEGR